MPGATVLKTVPYFFMLRRVALKAHGAHQEDGLHDVIHVGWLPNAPAERTRECFTPDFRPRIPWPADVYATFGPRPHEALSRG